MKDPIERMQIRIAGLRTHRSSKDETISTINRFLRKRIVNSIISWIIIIGLPILFVMACVNSPQTARKTVESTAVQSESSIDGSNLGFDTSLPGFEALIEEEAARMLLEQEVNEEKRKQINLGKSNLREAELEANDLIQEITQLYFDKKVYARGSIHYELTDKSAFANPPIVNWHRDQGVKHMLESDFPGETSIKLSVPFDRDLRKIEQQSLERYFQHLCEAGIVAPHKKASLNFSSPGINRLYVKDKVALDDFTLEEIKYD